jgi:hypothetical protein
VVSDFGCPSVLLEMSKLGAVISQSVNANRIALVRKLAVIVVDRCGRESAFVLSWRLTIPIGVCLQL